MKSKGTKECVERIASSYGLTQEQVYDIVTSNYKFAYKEMTRSTLFENENFPTVPIIGLGKFFHSPLNNRIVKSIKEGIKRKGITKK